MPPLMSLRACFLPPLIFVLVGPAIGCAIVFGSMISTRTQAGDVFAALFIAYFAGCIPALLTGCVYVYVLPLVARLPVLSMREEGFVAGLVSASPFILLIACAKHAIVAVECAIFLVPAAVCGVLAAHVRDEEEDGY